MADEIALPPRRDFLSWGVLVLGWMLVALWPGDVSWLMDEPRLIATAWHANHDGQLAVGGLYGNFGIRYGPLPTQVYQLLLLISHDPFMLVVLHGLLCAGVTGYALVWLARTLELPGWFAAGVLVSPNVIAYQRVLWDASFAMPVGALALASFADYVRTQRPWSLRGCVLASVLVSTIHPQALPLSAAILGGLAWQSRAALWRDRRVLGGLGVLVLVFNGFYFAQFAGQLFARLSGSMAKGYPGGASHWVSALAPLLGGRLLSGADYLQTLAAPSAPDGLHMTAQWCARLIYPLAWLGILVALRCGWRAIQQRKIAAATVRETVALVMLGGLLLQALLFGILRIPAAPQYFFGTFVLHVLAASLGVEALRHWRWGAVPGMLYLIGCASLSLEAAVSIHLHGFERPLWPTLASSVGVARELNHFADTTAQTDVAVYQKAPQALRTLRLLLPPAAGALRTTSGRLLITSDPHSTKPGGTTLIELAPHAAPPAGCESIDISPLPKDWVPDPVTW